MARGDADEHSDLDTLLWIADDEYDAVLAELPTLARGLGDTLDILFETPGSTFLFVQFADGVQLELSTGRASQARGLPPGHAALLDRDGFLAQPYEPPPPWDVDLWPGWAWMHLYDVDKFLRRGSLWEAFVTLDEARTMLVRHHAATTGVPDPEYGVRSILDAGGSVPARLGETVARLDAADIRRAARACADLLAEYEPRPFGDYVLSRLEA